MAFELGRRAVHATGVAVPLSYVLGVPWHLLQGGLVIMVVVAIGLEIVRLTGELDWRIFQSLTRSYEQHKIAGYALYAVGMATTALLFEPRIAIAGMLLLAISDPVGGLLAGDTPRRVKRPQALVGTFLVSVVLTLPVLPIEAAIAAAVGATLADGVLVEIHGYVIDDNLTIPVIASLLAWSALRVL